MDKIKNVTYQTPTGTLTVSHDATRELPWQVTEVVTYDADFCVLGWGSDPETCDHCDPPHKLFATVPAWMGYIRENYGWPLTLKTV
jgi:hypothetical protein